MRWFLIAALLIGPSACGVEPQPASAQTVAAFEVPLTSQEDRSEFLSMLRAVAAAHEMHVDAASKKELDHQASVSPDLRMTMNATVWKGTRDDESIASAMDWSDHLGQVWLTFPRGEDPALNTRFRENVMRQIVRRWPATLSLPIMPTGAIPHRRDLIRTPAGYVVNPHEAKKYELRSSKGQAQ